MLDRISNNTMKENLRQIIQEDTTEFLRQGGQLESLPRAFKASNMNCSQLWHREPLLFDDDHFN